MLFIRLIISYIEIAMTRQCCYLIMAGGTGGHIFPAMAVAKRLLENGSQIHWLGTTVGMEKNIVLSASINFHQIAIAGFRGKTFLQKFFAPVRLLLSIFQSMKILMDLNPDVVVGFGGYTAAPGGIAARLLGRKLVIHEQNSVAGSTNKLLSKIATKKLVAFPEALPDSILVGNPIRKEISDLFKSDCRKNKENKENKENKINLLVTGGSLGALTVNRLIPQTIKSLDSQIRPDVWHQTGKGKLQQTLSDYRELGIQARCEEFIDQMDEAYQWADIIICRSGALTVSEIAVVGIPAVFVPYPYAIDDHQKTNALWLVENDSAFMIEESDLTMETLTETLELLLKDRDRLDTMSKNMKKIAIPDATDRVVAICQEVCCGT